MPLRRALPILALAFLAACQSAEERAESHYQEALRLISSGDPVRAKLELRNVFDLDGFHRDAREAYAKLLMADGDYSGAYGHYLRLVEQYPDDLDARRALALLAVDGRNWDEVRRHTEAGLAAAPDDPGLRAAAAALAYRDATAAEDDAAAAAAAQTAGAVLADDPSLTAARLVMIDRILREGRPDAALALVDDGLALDENESQLRRLRIGILARMEDKEALGAELAKSAELFPEDRQIAETYLRFMLSEGDQDGAEAFLRARIDPENPVWEDRVALLQFLQQVRGPEALRAELDALLAAEDTPNRMLLRAMRAGLDFETGETEAAVSAMTELLDEADSDSGEAALDPAELARLHVTLARMRLATGDRVGARASVERALSIDPTSADAFKLRASWALEDDDPDAAITALRAALGAAPRDPEIMTLMAQAHLLNGDTDLASEMLARAVELSGSAPDESLRYAEFLINRGRGSVASGVLADALRLAPNDPRLLEATGRLYLAGRDWVRLDEIVERLNALPDEQGRTSAQSFRASALAAQERTDELEGLLTDLASEAGTLGVGAQAALVRTDISAGRLEEAVTRAEELAASEPDRPGPQLLLGAALAAANRGDEAKAALRAAVDADPTLAQGWIALARLATATEGPEAAAEVIAEGAAAAPASTELQWMRASTLEQKGDIPGAIAVYEEIYERDRSSLVVANNLASLLALTSDDPETIARAERISRRLKGADVPAFQDTYGWLAFLSGRTEEALDYLVPAAAGLPEDPQVQFHLASAQAEAGEVAQAHEALARARELAESQAALPGNDTEKLLASITRLELELPARGDAPATPTGDGGSADPGDGAAGDAGASDAGGESGSGAASGTGGGSGEETGTPEADR